MKNLQYSELYQYTFENRTNNELATRGGNEVSIEGSSPLNIMEDLCGLRSTRGKQQE